MVAGQAEDEFVEQFLNEQLPSCAVPVYPTRPLYASAAARPLTSSPYAADQASDVKAAATRVRRILDDPDAVVLSLNSIRSWDQAVYDSALAPIPVEVAITPLGRGAPFSTLIDPVWSEIPRPELRRLRLRQEQLDAAPTFTNVRDRILEMIKGRTVVVFDRAHVFGTLYCELEYDTVDGIFPNGYRYDETMVLLTRSRWECAQVLVSLHSGRWDAELRGSRLYKLPSGSVRAEDINLAIIRQLERVADTTVRYRELCGRARAFVRTSDTAAGSRWRDPAARAAVIERSQGGCESPECPNPYYSTDVTEAGEPLLHVDHVDDLAKMGHDADRPDRMIALCPNCHYIKTRGRTGERLRELSVRRRWTLIWPSTAGLELVLHSHQDLMSPG